MNIYVSNNKEMRDEEKKIEVENLRQTFLW